MNAPPFVWQNDFFSGLGNEATMLMHAFYIIMLIMLGFMLLVAVYAYVAEGIALYTIAKRRGYENPWMAWVPFANIYLLGSIADDTVVASGRNDWYIRWWLLGGLCGMSVLQVLGFIPLIGLIFILLDILLLMGYMVVFFMAIYEIFRAYDAKHAVVYLVLSIFFTFLLPIFLLVIRNKPALYGEGIKRPRVI